jgi:hypothetical protein
MEPARSGVCGAEEAASGPTAVCLVRIALNAKELARSAVCSAGEAASLVVMLQLNGQLVDDLVYNERRNELLFVKYLS